MSKKLKVTDLKEHPKNKIFFDDLEGDAWSEFLESIRTSGVIVPIVVTKDNVIISGHQRVKACIALGIDEIPAEVKKIDSEDEILKQLIETNIRQRGVGNTNPVKFGRCLMELERIYGIQRGGDRKSEEGSKPNNSALKSQEDLAAELGISKDSLQNYKKLAQAIPEMQELVESGTVSKTIALGLMKRLSEDEQRELAGMLPRDEKLSSHQVKFYESRIKSLDESNESLKSQVSELQRKERDLKEQIMELENEEKTEPQTVEFVVPDDYEELKERAASAAKAKKDADAYKRDYQAEQERHEKSKKRILALEDEINELKHATKEGLDSNNLSENVFYFCLTCNNFIGNVGGLVWLTDRIADMPDKEREMFLKAARSFRDWSLVFTQNLERNDK